MSHTAKINSILKELDLEIDRVEMHIILEVDSEVQFDLEVLRTKYLSLRTGLVKAKNALTKYGEEVCKSAYHMNRVQGYGANYIGNGNANVGDAQIAGGEYLAIGKAEFFKEEFITMPI